MTALPTTAPLDLADQWGGRSHVTDLDGPVHWVDFGGPASRVIAFEPHPVLGEMLAMTARANPGASITVERAACGSEAGTATT